jgi:CO dehydrogenase/acetyl-CoA synthase epsilon subunit
MNVTVKQGSVASLKAALKDTTRKLQAELRIAVNATANKSKSIINKEIRSELATTAKAGELDDSS